MNECTCGQPFEDCATARYLELAGVVVDALTWDQLNDAHDY